MRFFGLGALAAGGPRASGPGRPAHPAGAAQRQAVTSGDGGGQHLGASAAWRWLRAQDQLARPRAHRAWRDFPAARSCVPSPKPTGFRSRPGSAQKKRPPLAGQPSESCGEQWIAPPLQRPKVHTSFPDRNAAVPQRCRSGAAVVPQWCRSGAAIQKKTHRAAAARPVSPWRTTLKSYVFDTASRRSCAMVGGRVFSLQAAVLEVGPQLPHGERVIGPAEAKACELRALPLAVG